ncbi:MAG: hypothetical protein AABX53_02015 [Nanoarchaeota archaeon]
MRVILRSRVLFFLALGFFLITSALAAHIVTNVLTGTTSFGTVNEEVSVLYNFTLNNTDSGLAANITHVNITLPTNFSFTSGTVGTSFSYVSLTESSSLISFVNVSGLVLNASWGQIWFNATALVPGTNFNITVSTTNFSGSQHQNLTVSVNDTTSPSIIFVAPGLTTQSNLSRESIAVNVSAYDEGSLAFINVSLYNLTSILNSSNGSYGSGSFFVNFSNLSDGVYLVNVTVNDTNNNVNRTIAALRVILDHIAPSVSLSQVSNNQTSINISVSVTEAHTGLSGSCSVVSGGGTVSGSGSTQYLLRNGLDCEEGYTFNVSCTDTASNVGYGSGSFSTDDCDSSSSSSGGSSSGSSGSGSTYWDRTISVSSSDFDKGYSTILQQRERLRVSVGGLDHHMGVIDIDSDDITINISSVPQQAVLKINVTKLFEVSEDSYYDLSVTLRSINSSETGANITIYSVHELTPAGAAALAASNLGVRNSSSNESTSSAALGALFFESSWWIWVIIALVLVVVVLVAWKLYDRHQRSLGLRVSSDSS